MNLVGDTGSEPVTLPARRDALQLSPATSGSNCLGNEKVVGATGFEPATLPVRRDVLQKGEVGGRYRIRTCDPFGVNEVLYH